MRRWLPVALVVLALFTARDPLQAQAPTTGATSSYSEEALVSDKAAIHHAFDEPGTPATTTEFRIRVISAAGVQKAGTIVFPYRRELGTFNIDYVRVRKPSGQVIETPIGSVVELPAD